MEGLNWISIYLIYYTFIFILTKRMIQWYERNKWCTVNYQGKTILLGFGLGIVVHYTIFLILILMIQPHQSRNLGDMLLFLILLSVLCLIGWIDDHFGDNEVKGFSGHFYALVYDNKLTSGMLKAIYGLALSIFAASFYYSSLLEWTIASCLLLLSIHFFNLLDVRPGRAIKSFWILLLLIVPFLSLDFTANFTIPVVLSTYVLFQYDRRRIVMLGDTGSNVIGGIYGFLLITHLPTYVQCIYLLCFSLLALLAEKYSFTSYIHKKAWLAKLDNWGVR